MCVDMGLDFAGGERESGHLRDRCGIDQILRSDDPGQLPEVEFWDDHLFKGLQDVAKVIG